MTETWSWAKLGELARIELGRTPSRSNPALWDRKKETSNIWLSIADLLNAEGDRVVDSKEYVSDQGASICKLVKAGTLLVSFKLTLGRLAFAGRDLFTNEAIASLTICDESVISKEFLFWFLRFFDWQKATDGDVKVKGATLNKAKLKEIDVCFPSLPEQKRIVALLDEAFAAIDTAKANTERNLQNARALFESYLDFVLTQPSEDWSQKKLGDICQIKTGKKDVNQGNPDGEYPFFTCAATHTYSDTFSFDTEALLVAGNGNVGQVSYYSGKFEVYQRTYVLFGFESVTAKYLFRVLDKRLSARVSKQKLGNTMPYIKVGMLKEFDVPVPPLAAQGAIAAHLDEVAEEADRLTQSYEQKVSALEALRKSLLHQAFTGAL